MKNIALVKKQNALFEKGKSTYKLEINELSDFSRQETLKYLTGFRIGSKKILILDQNPIKKTTRKTTKKLVHPPTKAVAKVTELGVCLFFDLKKSF